MPFITHTDGLPIEVGDTVSGDMRAITGLVPNSGAPTKKIDFSVEATDPLVTRPMKTTGIPGIAGLKTTVQIAQEERKAEDGKTV